MLFVQAHTPSSATWSVASPSFEWGLTSTSRVAGVTQRRTAEATIRREALEECGFVIEPDAWRRFAVEHVAVPREGASFEKRSTFCGATLLDANGTAIEMDHVLVWLRPSEALGALTPLGHRWAVSEWLADTAAHAATATGE